MSCSSTSVQILSWGCRSETSVRTDVAGSSAFQIDGFGNASGIPAVVDYSWDNQDTRPKALTVQLRQARPKTTSYTFPEAPASADATRPNAAPSTPHSPLRQAHLLDNAATNPLEARYTRVRPPSDAIKLADRLYYLLQPSLEVLINEGALDFPFHPFSYQLDGVAFLYPRISAILADEMGLGKTMQAITAARMLFHAGEIRSLLLVCPKPLVTNWKREFALWAPELPLAVIEGDRARREWQWRNADVPVKLANYELLVRDRDLFSEIGAIEDHAAARSRGAWNATTAPASTCSPGSGGSGLRFDLVVLDESQRIKNRHGTTSEVVCSIDRDRSWALTGTPVENSPEDLVGIFEFVAPGHLHSEMKPRAMGRSAADYILRRTKDKVLSELPPKLFRDAEVELSAQQRATYQLAEDEGVLRLTEMGQSATIQHVFELVLRLKQICNFDPATGDSSKLERLAADLEEVAASGQKAIIFSQWVHTIEQLAARLGPFGVLQYHGRVAHKTREGVIERFRRERKRHVLLMSYGAGSVGLNLQFCNYVFLFDRWWNPAVEDQAINRAHRIGVNGPVTVTRFLALDTIEERINQILEEKRELFEAIFSDAEAHRRSGLTQQEIFGLFRLRCPQGEIQAAA